MEMDLSNISGVGGADQATGGGATDDASSMDMQQFEELMSQLPEELQNIIKELVQMMVEATQGGGMGETGGGAAAPEAA